MIPGHRFAPRGSCGDENGLEGATETSSRGERRQGSPRSKREGGQACLGEIGWNPYPPDNVLRDGIQVRLEVREQIIALSEKVVDEKELARALSLFDPVWNSLSPGEQARVMHLLVERVSYDGAEGKLSIAFRPTGIKALAEEMQAGGMEK